MKKLFTLLALLTIAVTQTWATVFIENRQRAAFNGASYFTTYTSVSGISSTSSIDITKSTSGTFTIAVDQDKLPGFHIEEIVFTASSADDRWSSGSSEQGSVSNQTDGVITFTKTTDTKPKSVTITASATSSGKLTITSATVTLSNGDNTDVCESLVANTSGKTGALKDYTTSSLGASSYLSAISTTDGTETGSNYIVYKINGNGHQLFLTTTRAIKEIYFEWISTPPASDKWNATVDEEANGSYDADLNKWTPTGTDVTDVTFTKTVGSNARLGNIHIVYQSAGPVDPTFSLSKASIGTDETAQIKVTGKDGLDGITLSDITYGTPGIVTVDASGVVTPVAAGTTTINFSSSAVDGKYNAKTNNQVPITVTAPKYTVKYELNGGNGTAPTQADTEEGGKFNLAAAPTKDFSTFAGWLCDADGQTYDAEAEYEMTAANTKFTAQWNVTTYSSTLDFAGETIKRAVYGTSSAPTGDKAFTNINTFLESGNMIGTSGLNNSNWEPSDEKTGYIGYKLKATSASVKFMAESGKKVTITFGSIGADVTLKKNGVSSTISANSGDQKQTVVSFDANEDMLVEIVTSSTSNKTVTLNKIAIENAVASTVVNVGTTGFATIGLPYVSTVPADVTAYTVTPTTSSKVTLSPVEAGATIPAYKGLIIVAEPGNHTFTQKFTEGTSTYDTGTGLLATGAVTRNAAPEAGEFYYFAIIDSTNKKVGFKKCAEGATLAANRAYLPGAKIPAASTTLSISFEGEETAINGVAEEASDAAPVKVVKNGQLFIGNYNVAGAQVK